jgi:ABC-type transporter Mla subunit MlaD
VRHFFHELLFPKRTARAIPLGRLAIVSMLVFVALFVAFTLRSMGVQLPFVTNPYVIHAWFDDAAGLDPSNGPPVSVAGVPEGEVTAVSYEQGRALVTMSLGSDARGKVFKDASVRVRPFNGANFLEVDVLPGDPATGALAANGTIDASRTSIPVATDQVLDVLNADTRAYLQILTEQAAVALHGTGGVLGGALAKLAPLSNSARQIGAMLAQRDRLISQLVGDSNAIFRTLGHRHAELASAIGAATRVLTITGSRTRELALATRQLPSVLAQGQATGSAIATAAPDIQLALQKLAPAATAFATGLRTTRAAIPGLYRFLDAAHSLVQHTLTPSSELARLAGGLQQGIAPAISSYESLTQIIQTLIDHEQPIEHFSDALSGVLSTQDAYGVLGRVKFIGIEPPNPADLGLSSSAADPGKNGHSQLQLMVAQALDGLCRRDPVTCVLGAATPGIPGSVVSLAHALVPRLNLGGSR